MPWSSTPTHVDATLYLHSINNTDDTVAVKYAPLDFCGKGHSPCRAEVEKIVFVTDTFKIKNATFKNDTINYEYEVSNIEYRDGGNIYI